jgi:hypothetical protein
MEVLLEELYADDGLEKLLGNSPSELQVRQYPQAVALALVLRHSWRADDLACILARLGVRHGSSLKKIQAGQVERRQKRHGSR